VITWCGVHFTGRKFTWHYVFLLAYFTAVTLVLLAWQERRAATDMKGFIRRFMLGMVIKLLGSMIVLLLLLRLEPKEVTKQLGLVFTLLYVAFLIFTTLRLTMVVRRASDVPNNES